jgi:hypothetical protein
MLVILTTPAEFDRWLEEDTLDALGVATAVARRCAKRRREGREGGRGRRRAILERQPIGLNRGGLNEAAIAAEVADVGFEVM